LTLVVSCSKTNNYTNYFSFEKATYPVTINSRDTVHYTMTFADPTTSETGTITCGFDTFSHLTSGQYKVVSGAITTTPGQMTLLLTVGLTTYNATGTDSVSANVTISPAGKFSISLPSVRVGGLNLSGAPDTSNLAIHVTEIN
jgi:hypothetical protein